ncbi:MAG: ABC transporter ATP-binding protein [Sphingobacteriales bacterium]|nr:MAG: ABC transporter ATP-binding protein [Sphingobacteriales bacterium]
MSFFFSDTHREDIVRLKDIHQSYDNGKFVVLQDFNLLIEDKPNQGQFVVILGASGCGKSTILRYISGLQRPTSGEVNLYGNPRKESDRVGMVFQKYSSLPWLTVLDNVALGLYYQGIPKKEREEKAREMIKKVGLEGHENKYAQYPILSGGQLQRVAIARSLLANPRILLMDEPFGALDVNTRLQMQDMLLNIWYEVHPTIIFVTHDISEAVYLGDDIYIMRANPGQIVEHIYVDLPYRRDRFIKRTPRFEELVHYTEDLMVRVDAMSKK